MPDGEKEIAYCHACGTPMDVGSVAPFSNVECPNCRKHTRVKREFGPYTLLRRHAIGGMSVVFIAHDNTLDREVIVKILNEEYGGDDKRIAAFEEEARITASFSHPHVVRVFTTGRAFGRFYIAMELVGGGHYEHHIRERGSIPESEVLPLAIQVAEGLKAAQAAGLIHRDVKPGNILLDAGGNAKIVDFGLALVTKGGKAQAAEIWATPYYVPPETIEGLPEDFRSDIYAFGATFYHALAGKPPCNEESMDTNKLREAKRKIQPLAKAAPWVSADTCAAIDRAMAHDPAQRFRSYDDLAAALKAALQRSGGAPVAAGETAGSGAAGRREARGGGKLALAAAAAVVLASLGFGVWRMVREEPAPPAVADKRAEPAQAGDQGETAGAVALRIGGAYRDAGEALRSGNYGKARTAFGAVRDDPGVLEPTGSWAACEAVIAAYFDGKPDVARREARAALDHIESAEGLEAGIRESLIASLAPTGGLMPAPPPEGDAVPSGPDLIASLIGGLRNWEHGMPLAALPHFEAVMRADPSGADAWVGPYRDVVAGYLDDHKRLSGAEPAVLPDDAATCKALVDELHALHAGLKTKGRARFNVRVWQLELEKRARELERRQPEPEPAPVVRPDPLAEAREAARRCDFVAAVEWLKSADPSEERDGLLLLAEAAAGFLGGLEDRLDESPSGGIALKTRDGGDVGRVTGSRRGGLRAEDASGGAREFGWAELSPDSLIELHRTLVRSESNEIERLRRHEQAIAYDLLAGDRERGMEAAATLSAGSPAFKRRWQVALPALE